MDVATIDNEFQQLQAEANQTAQAIQALAQKLQTASQAGDPNAREWILDLKDITLQIQQEQLQTQALLQALHGFAVNTMQQPPPPANYYAAPAAPPQSGGILSRFTGGGFGQAMTRGLGMGAGFGIADSLINSIFN